MIGKTMIKKRTINADQSILKRRLLFRIPLHILLVINRETTIRVAKPIAKNHGVYVIIDLSFFYTPIRYWTDV